MATSPIISAEAILPSAQPHSLTESGEPLSLFNVTADPPSERAIAIATRELQALGFTVFVATEGLMLQAAATQFETVFQVKLKLIPDDLTGIVYVHHTGEVVIPETLQGVITAIAFPEPPEYFTGA